MVHAGLEAITVPGRAERLRLWPGEDTRGPSKLLKVRVHRPMTVVAVAG